MDINRELFTNKTNLDDPVEDIIAKFANHPTILKIKEKGFQANRFSFLFVSENDVCSVIKNVDSSKAYQKDTIPPKVLKENADVLCRFLKDDISLNIDKGKFPDNLENADITPISKKLDRNLKSNYRAISILPTSSKIYKKLFYQQMYEHYDSILSKYWCGYRRVIVHSIACLQGYRHSWVVDKRSSSWMLFHNISVWILFSHMDVSYGCPIWMCHTRKIFRQINKIHERAFTSSLDELIETSECLTVHHRNLLRKFTKP